MPGTTRRVSTYLYKLPISANIKLCGPQIGYKILKDVDEILFLEGGTGIAPALQMVYTFFECCKDAGFVLKLRVLWVNRRREDLFGGISETLLLSRTAFLDLGK